MCPPRKSSRAHSYPAVHRHLFASSLLRRLREALAFELSSTTYILCMYIPPDVRAGWIRIWPALGRPGELMRGMVFLNNQTMFRNVDPLDFPACEMDQLTQGPLAGCGGVQAGTATLSYMAQKQSDEKEHRYLHNPFLYVPIHVMIPWIQVPPDSFESSWLVRGH